MKRSQINQAIRDGIAALDSIGFNLPGFSIWDLETWKKMKKDAAEIIQTGMGWDVTDFGSGEFKKIGATIFTMRNGVVSEQNIGVPYAEKIIIMEEGQMIPLHFHFKKTEDIINRGGGVLCVKFFCSNSDETIDETTRADIKCDGILRSFEPGEVYEVTPGNSITLKPGGYHAFWAKEGAGTLVCGEVSSVNDDNVDNRFHNPMSRFAEIEEDEPIAFLLCNEYEKVLG